MSYLLCEGTRLFVKAWPFCNNAAGSLQLGLLGEGVVAQVYGLGILLGGVPTPGLTPQPLLHRQTLLQGGNHTSGVAAAHAKLGSRTGLRSLGMLLGDHVYAPHV